MLFIGRYEHNLDEKSRLMMPTKLRDKLNGTLYMTYGLGRCIYLYTEEMFMKICNQRSKINDLSKEGLGFKRVFFSNSVDCKLDNQGRILISKDLQKRVSIVKETIIIGNDDHIEIWDKNRYEQMELEYLENYDSYAETLSRRLDYGEE